VLSVRASRKQGNVSKERAEVVSVISPRPVMCRRNDETRSGSRRANKKKDDSTEAAQREKAHPFGNPRDRLRCGLLLLVAYR